MDAIKRQHFEANHAGVPFPVVESVAQDVTSDLRTRIAQRLRVSADNKLQLVKSVRSRSRLITDVRADAADFDLGSVLWRERIHPATEVYLNWHRFDNIDTIAAADLIKWFSDLWYPSSDDIDVFDETCDWILSVDHSGEVRLARLHIPRAIGG